MQPTPVLQKSIRRLALTTKQTGRGFYKGTRTGSMGWHTSRGGYMIDYRKVRTYIVPDLTDFELTPFVTKRVELPSEHGLEHPGSGERYLREWQEINGET